MLIQGGFFNCSHPKISKYKKKPKYTNCSRGNSSEMSKSKYCNCSTLLEWEQFEYFNFFLSLFFSGWEQF